jgi:small subunit ribosomal protein S16
MGVGALPTEAVEAIFKITGDWQKAKGLPGTEGTLRKAAEKPHKRVAYEAAVKDAMDEPKDGATTMKKKAAEKLAAKSAPAEVVAEAPAEVVAEEAAPEVVAEAPAEVVAEVPAEESAAE